MVLLLSLLLSLLLPFSLPLTSSSVPTFSSLATSAPLPLSLFHSSLGSSFGSPSFFFGSFFSSSAVSSSCLLFHSSILFACSASLVSARHFPSAPVDPPRGFSAPRSFPQAPLSSASLVSSVSSTPALSSLGALPGFSPISSLFSSSLSSSPAVEGLAVFPSKVFGLSAYFQGLDRWFVASGGSAFCSYLAFRCPPLFSDFLADFAYGSYRFLSALSFFASIPPPFSVTTSLSSVSAFPSSSGSGSLSFFSGSFCCSASLHCSFVDLSTLCGFFFFPSSGPPGSSGVFCFFVVYLFLLGISGGVLVLLRGSVRSLFLLLSRTVSSPFSAVVVPAATLPSTFHSTPSAPVFYPGTSSSSSAAPPPFPLVSSFVALDGFRGMWLRPLCFTMRTRWLLLQFRGLCGLSLDACSLSLGIAFCRLWVFFLLLLLLVLFSKFSLATLLLLLLLLSSGLGP